MADDDEDEGGGGLAEEQKCAEGAPDWVVTFGDMMSLLLTFFILLLSFAQMEVQKYKLFSGSVMKAFGVQEVTPVFTRPQGRSVVKDKFSMRFSSPSMLQGMKAASERHANRSPDGRVDIEVYEDYRGIVVSIGEDAMFERGRADVRPAVWPFLDDVLVTATQSDAQIQVQAHTDSVPINSAVYPSNDHLSAARSVAVVRHFLGRADRLLDEPIDAARLEAVPYGENRPRAPNNTEAGRAKNRRVELVFYQKPRDFRRDE